MPTTTYEVHVERDGDFWLIHVPEVDRWTQARSLSESQAMARSLISSMLDVDAGSFDIDEHIQLSKSVQMHLESARRLRDEAADANSAAAREARAAARELADAGLTVRDVGTVLGVSHQRAHQLVKG